MFYTILFINRFPLLPVNSQLFNGPLPILIWRDAGGQFQSLDALQIVAAPAAFAITRLPPLQRFTARDAETTSQLRIASIGLGSGLKYWESRDIDHRFHTVIQQRRGN